MSEETLLPSGWTAATVGDLAQYVRGVSYDKTQAHKTPSNDRVVVLRANNLGEGHFDTSDLVFVDASAVSAEQFVQAEDIVFAMSSGSKRHVGKSVLANRSPNAAFGAFCGLLRPNREISAAFLAWQFQGRAYRRHVESVAMGTNINNLKSTELLGFRIVVAPVREQHRIVAKIEELFSELDKAVESLTLARAQLKTYRQALLKAAFEGRLTADWRAANPDKLEPPETLLARIRAEREARYKQALADWQSALAEWRADGEVGRKPAKPDRPAPIEIALGHDDLPEGWTSISTASLGHVETGNTPSTKFPEYFSGAVPFLKPTDLDAGYWVREARDHLSEEGLAVSRGFPPNTILVTCIGATIGKTGLSRVGGACNQQINFVVPDSIALPAFVFFQMIGPRYQEQIKDNASSTTLPILNKGRFCELPFAVCGRAEQAAILTSLEEKLSQTEAAEVEIDRAVARASALRQSILKEAFAGQLVPQDRTDEPAAALLARLREQAPPARTRRRKTA